MRLKHFEVKKWVRLQTALKETVTFDKLLQHAKQHEADHQGLPLTQVQWRSHNVYHNQRDQNLHKKKARDLRLEPGPEVRVRYVVRCGTSHPPRECPSMGQKVPQLWK